MDLPGDEELLRLFHCSKTEMSCMENPHMFIRQLRDYDLIPEQLYEKVNRTKSKETLKRGLYDILDWFEREQSESIKMFWTCVFKKTIVNQYPTLLELRNSLRDGEFQLDMQRLNSKAQDETTVRKRKELSENENVESVQELPVLKKKRKNNNLYSDEEQPTQSSSVPKKKKIAYYSPPKGSKNDLWTWPIYKINLPVTCGNEKGTLNRDRLSKGQSCILVNKKWLTPSEFECLGGKRSNKNWKLSIRCMDTPLAKLLETGHLQKPVFRQRGKKAKTLLFTSDESSNTDSNHEFTSENQDSDVQPQEMPSSSHDANTNNSVLNVTCGALAGKLHKKRFASGTCGLSIRTDTGWMTPADFVKEALENKDASWKKDILWEDQPLGVVIHENLLSIHSLLCNCKLCRPTDSDLEEQKNDDECCVCKSEGDLVVCDNCPRSFHSACHLPHIDSSILSDNRTWICTFCIFSTTQEWRYSDQLESDLILSKQISKHMLECQYLLLLLSSADDEQFFATDPCGYLKDYKDVVKTPMWLCKIAEKIKTNEYLDVAEFVTDVQLIFSNCALYNKNNPRFLSMGSRLKKLFDEEFKKAF